MASVLSLWPCAQDMAGWGTDSPDYQDAAAFGEYYSELWPQAISRLRWHYGCDEVTAQDIAQDAFMVLWRDAGKLVGGMDVVRMYFWRTVKFLVIQHWRRQARMVSFDSVRDAGGETFGTVVEMMPAHADVEREVLGRMELQDTLTALQQCSRTLRQTVLLSAQGYSNDEIAQRLHCASRVTVNNRLHQARFQLRVRLREQRQVKRSHARGRWSIHYAACVACGTTERHHAGNGLCMVCRHRLQRQRLRAQPLLYGVWHKEYVACVQCGTTERAHESLGMCGRCYSRQHSRRLAQQRALQRRQAKAALPPAWHRRYAACVVCGTTKRRYESLGMCQLCYNRMSFQRRHAKQSVTVS